MAGVAHQDAEAVAPGGLRGQFEQDGEWVQDWERAVGEMLVTQVGIHIFSSSTLSDIFIITIIYVFAYDVYMCVYC